MSGTQLVDEVLKQVEDNGWRVRIHWGDTATGVATSSETGYVVNMTTEPRLYKSAYPGRTGFRAALDPENIVKIEHTNKSKGGVLYQAPELDLAAVAETQIKLRAMAKRLAGRPEEGRTDG